MAKKNTGEKLKAGFKKLYVEYKDKALVMLNNFFKEQGANIIEMLKDMLKIRQIIKKYIISAVLGIAAVVVLLMGLSNVLAMYFTKIAPGWWQIIVGLVILLGISVYMKK
jgi:sterol desaturase/sphingolipid hydroxylase (fatty acid hydroxylase superfamily)